MKDALGNDLHVGDRVVFVVIDTNLDAPEPVIFHRGIVDGFSTERIVRISVANDRGAPVLAVHNRSRIIKMENS